jgi:hypothetical protein
MTLAASSVWSKASVDELRAELQVRSRATTENFNAWQAVRKTILENKNLILEHRNAMQVCLSSLRKSFDEKVFNSCSVDNYAFAYTAALMPKSSTSLKFPSADFTGGTLSRATLELTLQFHQWVAMAQRDVKNFIDAAAPLYKNSIYTKLTKDLDAAKERGEKTAFCANTVALTYSTEAKGEDLRFVVAKAFGNLLGMNIALANIRNFQAKINYALAYCAPVGDAIFGPVKLDVDKIVATSENILKAMTPEERVKVFCLKTVKFRDEDIAHICDAKSITPEIFSSIHAIITNKLKSRGGQQ